jgi:hypothetical protein
MQTDYHFWQDLFDTYRSLSDWVKLAWLVAPVSIALFALWLVSFRLRGRIENLEGASLKETIPPGELVYTIRRDEQGSLIIYRHADKTEHELLLEEY